MGYSLWDALIYETPEMPAPIVFAALGCCFRLSAVASGPFFGPCLADFTHPAEMSC
jgi:hypothetical protein